MAAKAAWVPRLLKCKGDNWTEIPLKYMNRLGKDEYILRTMTKNSKMCPMVDTLPEFYQQVIMSFNRAKLNHPGNLNLALLGQPLFANHNVKLLLNGYERIPYFTSWINSGFECIGNLKLRDGKIDIYEQYK